MRCPACDSPNPPEAVRCEECGKRMPPRKKRPEPEEDNEEEEPRSVRSRQAAGEEQPRARRRRPEEDDDDEDAEEYERRPRRRRRKQDEDDYDDGGISTLIPYKNPKALTSYYVGIFSLIPIIGVLLAPVAIVLGILGIRHRNANPQAKGTAHAIIGVVLGSASLLCQVFGTIGYIALKSKGVL